jgi:hypothetical protein
VPLVLMCACLPMHALSAAQDGISRSYNWIDMALVPGYIVRPLIILAFMAGFYFAGFPSTALYAMISTVVAYWFVTVTQMFMLDRRLREKVPAGPRKLETRFWLATAFPIFMVESFYFLLTYADILILELYVDPAQIAVYYAATKILALVAFVYFAVSAATAHRFAEYHVSGQREKLERFLSDSVKWTFWPSLAGTIVLLVLGKFLLSLFGEGFDSGYGLLFVLAAGLLARAGVGPVERLLNMVGEQKSCAMIYALAFVYECCALLHPDPALQALWRGDRDLGGDDVRIRDAVSRDQAQARPARLCLEQAGVRLSRLFAQHPADHFSGRRHRHASTKAISRGYSCAASCVFTKFWISLGERIRCRVSGLQLHEGFHDLGAERIGLADDRGERHGRMADEAIFDFAGADAIARRSNHVVVAADEEEIALARP